MAVRLFVVAVIILSEALSTLQMMEVGFVRWFKFISQYANSNNISKKHIKVIALKIIIFQQQFLTAKLVRVSNIDKILSFWLMIFSVPLISKGCCSNPMDEFISDGTFS